MAVSEDSFLHFYKDEENPEAIQRLFRGYFQLVGKEMNLPQVENPVIAGGACRSWVIQEKPKDIDVYFTNKQNLEAFDNHFNVNDLKPVMKFNEKTAFKESVRFDIIRKAFKDQVAILKTFDLTISMCSVSADTVVCHKDYLADLASKSIVFANLENPLGSLVRMQKYVKYGYTASPKELEALATAIYLLNEEPKLSEWIETDDITGEVTATYFKNTGIVSNNAIIF